MTFDKWFNQQSLLVKILLLIIPVVGQVTEILVRVSAFLRNKDLTQLLLTVVLSLCHVLNIADVICLILKGRLAFTK